MLQVKHVVTATTLAFYAIVAAAVEPVAANPPPPAPESVIENAFQLGVILKDTNGDKIADVLCGHVIVPDKPAEAENVAAANLAARLGFETTALTLPVVTTVTGNTEKQCTTQPVNLWVGRDAVPLPELAKVDQIASELHMGEGAVISINGGLAFIGVDGIGLLAAANAYAARAPYQWSLPGAKLQGIAQAVNVKLSDKKINAQAELSGITYEAGQQGIDRAILHISGSADAAAIRTALTGGDGNAFSALSVREFDVMIDKSAPVTITNTSSASASRSLPARPDSAADEPRFLDLGSLYGINGLLSGSPKKLIPSSVAATFYIPAGAEGTALANLAARAALETTGMTLPIAMPAAGFSPSEIHNAAVITGASQLTSHAEDLLGAPDGSNLEKLLPGQFAQSASAELTPLKPGEGELRTVDRAFGASPALLVRGDSKGAVAAIGYGSQHLPYLWEHSKKYASVEEIRDDLQQFFSLRSSAGQASVAMYHLDQWTAELASANPQKKFSSVEAEVDVDQADPKLSAFIRSKIESRLKPAHIDVKIGTLHAGTKCCDGDVPLHNNSTLIPFKQADPTFAEDIVIPWEGRRLKEAVQAAAGKIEHGQPVSLEARVSEGPEERSKLQKELLDILKSAGADPQHTAVVVLCAYKPGYSWLVDEVEPALKSAHVQKVKIQFAPYLDPEKTSGLRVRSRWAQEIFPVDEVLARDLQIPLKNIEIDEAPEGGEFTYKVQAFGADGSEILTRNFTVKKVAQTYSAQFPHYDTVNVDTGWVHLEAAQKVLLDERIQTDPEVFWDHYQTETLPHIFKLIMQQNNGRPKTEFQPLFDTLKISFKMSEPDYNTGIDQERISSLEGLQEDTFFSTQNFFFMMGDLVADGAMDYQGRVIPVAYPSQEGQDGHVRIEYYAKDAGFPQVRFTWKTEQDPEEHEKTRELPALKMGKPRLVAARVEDGEDAAQALVWSVPADFRDDHYDTWITEEVKGSVEHTIFSSQQGIAQLHWLEQMHAAGIYQDSLAYPHLHNLGFEFVLPLEANVSEHTKNAIVAAQFPVSEPLTKRPQITDITPAPLDAQQHFVSWDLPIGPSQEEHLMSRLATYPGVDAYWMGRTYLGRDIWAADIMLPTPSELRSYAKETTLKAAIIYSGRQHANEVSSTSHILRLAEQLVTDPQTREDLKKVNVVVHPITNVDGAQLSMDLAKLTPDFMLHPGYHASLTADLTTAQWDDNPIYPESSTRRLLWRAWLPDAFLNPHGYPTHEWVQPFSEYAAWVITRMEAEYGRTNWVPRGWFTSLFYLGDADHLNSKTVTYNLRDRIVDNMAKAPGVLAMNASMNDRYQRFQHWDPPSYQQPIYKGVRIYMALKGQTPSAGSNILDSFMLRYPDITYDDGYTEAPDETAYGDFLHLVASAGLAFDRAHLDYFAEGKFKIKQTQKEFYDGVQWSVDRERPVLPMNAPDASEGASTPAASQ
jgi:hypothetical protein